MKLINNKIKNMFKKGFSTILVVVIVLVVIAGGVLIWQWPESQSEELDKAESPIVEEDNQPPVDEFVEIEERIKQSVEKVLSSYARIPDGTRLLSVSVIIDDTSQITLDFSQELISQGMYSVLEDSFHQITFAIGEILSELDVRDVEYFSLIEGIPLQEYFDESTIDWQTYQNGEYGFEVDYPQEWTSKEFVSNPEQIFGIVFYDKEKPETSIDVQIFAKNQTIDEFTQEAELITSVERFYIENYQAVRIGREGAMGGSIRVFAEGHVLVMSHHYSAALYWQRVLGSLKLVPQDIKVGSAKPLDFKALQEIQDEVNGGHQPWRLDAVLVARGEGYQYGFEETDTLTLLSKELNENAGTYISDVEAIHDGKKYIIQLIQPIEVGSTGIWTINSIGAEE